jgi:ABC-type multidrug transport system fused ATPase/permease subunit
MCNEYSGVIIFFFLALFILTSYLIFVYGQIMASRNLHKKLLLRIMRAPMSFFDTTPLGRIINRFSKDVEVVDSVISVNSESYVDCLLSVIFTLIVVSRLSRTNVIKCLSSVLIVADLHQHADIFSGYHPYWHFLLLHSSGR